MSNGVEIISSIDKIWEKIPADAREAWEAAAVLKASTDPQIETMVGLLPLCTGAFTPEALIRKIGERLEERYDAVPAARRPEVIRKAGDNLIWREMGLI